MLLYLDLIWLLNFFIDYLLLWMTALVRKIEVKKWRLVLASAIGSSYVLFLFLPPLLTFYTFGVKLLLSLLLVFIAFGYGQLYRFMLSFFTFYFVSFVIGGGLLAVHFVLQSNHQLMQGMVATFSGGYGDKVSWLFVLIGFPFMYWFSKLRLKQFEKTGLKAGSLAQVKITVEQKHIHCTGLIDTGNLLYEPVSQAPVIILEASAITEEQIPLGVLEALKQLREQATLPEVNQSFPEQWFKRVKLLPYRGIQQGMQLMGVFKPDLVTVYYDNQQYESHEVYVGIQFSSLSREGLFQTILHPALIQKPKIEEALRHAH
jgi:stage II sporulation protein GA (sporulation sigma-E factor processing peptidase)